MTQPQTSETRFTFVDLFAGIGGFHAALSAMGGRCVYAVELDPAAAAIYERNWGMNPLGDITEDANDDLVRVPPHDVLAAGFPCQPFSKSGAQLGMEEARGTLYWNILRIIQEHHPSVVILENVRNIAGPRHQHEWRVIIETLRAEGYQVSDQPAIFSPHLLPPELGGRPQVRERVFITATWLGNQPVSENQLVAPAVSNTPVEGWNPKRWNLESHLPLDADTLAPGCALSDQERMWLDAWDDLVLRLRVERHGKRLPGFPLWADDWNDLSDLRIPPGTPAWKAGHLTKNAEFYTEHRRVLDQWAGAWGIYSDRFPPSRRKFEWQAQDTPSLKECVIHLRPSGIRAKAPTYVPALVAINQTSIVGSRGRRLSTREAARLQGLPEWFDFGEQSAAVTYRQLGNGVSIGAVWHVVKAHAARDAAHLERVSPRVFNAITGSPDSPDEVLSTRYAEAKPRLRHMLGR